jgi:hypothetical protein
MGGKHLILMRYPAEHDPDEEWVYNGAEIDSAQLVWAHDLGSDTNRKLLVYYPDRRVWLVQPRPDGAHVSQYRP